MKYALLFAFLLSGFSLKAQMYYNNGRQLCCGDSLLVGNHRALGINPANLGRSGTLRKSFGVLQFGGSYYTEGLNLKGLSKLSFTDDSLSREFKSDWLDNIEIGESFTFSNNLDMEWLSFSIASENLGGIGFSLKERVSSYAHIPGDMLSLMLDGKDSPVYQQKEQLPAAGNGSSLFYSHIREASIGYGRKIFKTKLLSLYAGATVKKLWGIGYFRTDIVGDQLSGLSSFSNFYRINYGEITMNNIPKRNLLDASGQGYAYDFGVAADLFKVLHVSLSVTDIGSVSWDKQVLSSNINFGEIAAALEEGVINSAGFSEELESVYDNFQFGEGEAFTTPLNTRIRQNIVWSVSSRLSLSTDFVMPLNKNKAEVLNFHPATFTAALSWSVIPGMLNLSSGYFYSDVFGTRLPLGISIGISENAMISLSTADVLTFVIDSENPYPGISFTTLNYKF